MVDTTNNDYLDDATPCITCNREPTEMIGQCEPFIIFGIEVGPRDYGTYLRCPTCGKKTVACTNPQEAYKEWNEVVNKKEETNNA